MDGSLQPVPRLKEFRQRRGLTQEELSVLSGVPRRTIARHEAHPEKRLRRAARLKLAKALKVRPEELLKGYSPKTSARLRSRLWECREAGADGGEHPFHAAVSSSFFMKACIKARRRSCFRFHRFRERGRLGSV